MKLSKNYELQGLIWKNLNGSWCRRCPKCNNIIEHTGIWSKSGAARRCRDGVRCHVCAGKEQPPITEMTRKKISEKNKGKVFSLNRRINISNALKGKKHNDERKRNTSVAIKNCWKNENIRKKYYDAIGKTKWIKVRTDVGFLHFLNKWNNLGFNFEPNYQLHTDNFLCYIDGYDKEHNVVIEYDAKYHKKLNQRQKDLIRQQKIIDILKPKKFWRYDVVNKRCRNILEE